MIDSHCHLDHEPLLSDLDNILQRSKNIGIEKLLQYRLLLKASRELKKLSTKIKLYMALLVYILTKQIKIKLKQNLLSKILKKIKKSLVLEKQD